MVRTLDVRGQALHIEEGTELENEAGAVLWDAGLVLIGYLCHREQGRLQRVQCWTRIEDEHPKLTLPSAPLSPQDHHFAE